MVLSLIALAAQPRGTGVPYFWAGTTEHTQILVEYTKVLNSLPALACGLMIILLINMSFEANAIIACTLIMNHNCNQTIV